MTVGCEYVVIGPMVLVLVLSLDTCGLGLVSFGLGLGLGLGLEPCGLVNITVGRFGPASGRTDAFCAPRRPHLVRRGEPTPNTLSVVTVPPPK